MHFILLNFERITHTRIGGLLEHLKVNVEKSCVVQFFSETKHPVVISCVTTLFLVCHAM